MTLYFNTTESQTGNSIHKVNITMVMSTSINKRHHFLRYILMSVNILMLSIHIGEFSMYKITVIQDFYKNISIQCHNKVNIHNRSKVN